MNMPVTIEEFIRHLSCSVSRCNGRTGLSPAALIRRRQSSSEEEEQLDAFESEKDIYEGLNIHRPPPRRQVSN